MAENLSFSIGADTAAFHSGIGGVLTGLAGLAAAFVSVQAVVEAFSQAIDMGGRLNDLSARTGETAGNLAVLERAFELNSVSADKLGMSISKMQKNLEEFAAGNKTAGEGFTQLGISLKDLGDKAPIEQLQLIGTRLSAIQDPALRSATAMSIFGKSGAELLPVLLNFSQNLAQAREQLGSLPEQLDRSAASVDTLGDNLFAIRNKLTEMAYGFLSEVIPAVNLFTSKLAGIDAAGLGAQLADTLVGAFANPMKAAQLLSDAIILGAKKLGNELIFQVQYWGELMINTLGVVGTNIIPMLGNNMAGAFEMAVGLLGKGLLAVVTPFVETIQSALSAMGLGDIIHSGDIQTLAEGADALMASGAEKIAESANVLQMAFEAAKGHSTVIRQDFFGVEGSSDKIVEDWAKLEGLGKAAIDSISDPVSAMRSAGFSQSGTELLDAIQRADASTMVSQTSVLSGGGTSAGTAKTAAQIQAELTRQLGIISGAAPNQAIGQSSSARRAMDLQKRLDVLVAQGKGDTAEAAALATSIFTHQQIAQGNVLTASDKEAARQMALDQWMDNTTLSFSDLQSQAEANILESKMADSTAAQEQKKKADAAGAGGADKPKMNIQSIAQAVLQLLQKIEPKLPQHIMS